jgi:hypothetical protein
MSGIYSVRADEVEFRLEHAPFRYPTKADPADPELGWGHVAVIPELFEWVTNEGDLPSVESTAVYLMSLCNPRYAERPLVRRRGEKLVLDFFRDLHTYGLLCECSLFGQVVYKKALDVTNIDYLARLRARWAAHWGFNEPVAVQAMMRARWFADGDAWSVVKEERRGRRGNAPAWDGKLYLLTNRQRPPWKQIAGVWLFGPQHIRDLADEVSSDLAPEPPMQVAIQMRMEL